MKAAEGIEARGTGARPLPMGMGSSSGNATTGLECSDEIKDAIASLGSGGWARNRTPGKSFTLLTQASRS